MALNGTARNTSIGHKDPAEEMGDYEEKLHIDGTFCFSDTEMKVSLQPLDVLCAVLLCSDSFLQYESLLKISMCHCVFRLEGTGLPTLDTPKYILMVWAMRETVRKWSPHPPSESKEFREESSHQCQPFSLCSWEQLLIQAQNAQGGSQLVLVVL